LRRQVVDAQVVITFIANVMLSVPVMNGFSCDWLRTPVPSVASMTNATIENAVKAEKNYGC
jgi:hypothetical protein